MLRLTLILGSLACIALGLKPQVVPQPKPGAEIKQLITSTNGTLAPVPATTNDPYYTTYPAGCTVNYPPGTTVTYPAGATVTYPQGTQVQYPSTTPVTYPTTTTTVCNGAVYTYPAGSTVTYPANSYVTYPAGTCTKFPQQTSVNYGTTTGNYVGYPSTTSLSYYGCQTAPVYYPPNTFQSSISSSTYIGQVTYVRNNDGTTSRVEILGYNNVNGILYPVSKVTNMYTGVTSIVTQTGPGTFLVNTNGIVTPVNLNG